MGEKRWNKRVKTASAKAVSLTQRVAFKYILEDYNENNNAYGDRFANQVSELIRNVYTN